MIVKYRPAAISDLQETAAYIRDTLQNPAAAERLTQKVLHGISLLKENPFMGTMLSSRYESFPSDIRYLVINRQMVFYEVTDTVIEIIRILDGRTDYLTKLSD